MLTNKLSQIDALTNSSQFPVMTGINSSTKRVPASNLKSFIFDDIRQEESPSTGFNIQINDSNENVFLILSPGASLASGTLTFPLNTNAADKQIISIFSENQITSITFDGNGATVFGEPSALAAESYLTFRYDLTNDAWYRVA